LKRLKRLNQFTISQLEITNCDFKLGDGFSNPKPTNEMLGYYNLFALKNDFMRSDASSASNPVRTCVLG